MAMTLTAKLQLKPGQRLLLQNVPADARAMLADALGDLTLVDAGKADAVVLYVNDLAETKKLSPKAFKAVGQGGLVWIAYPKGTSGVKTDVNRDKLWQALEPTGWRPVRQVAIDDTWSALRFRPEAEVGSSK